MSSRSTRDTMAGSPVNDTSSSELDSPCLVDNEVSRRCKIYDKWFRREAQQACNKIVSMWKKLWRREAIMGRLEIDKSNGKVPKGWDFPKHPPMVPDKFRAQFTLDFFELRNKFLSDSTDSVLAVRRKEYVQLQQDIARESTKHLAYMQSIICNIQEHSVGRVSDAVALGIMTHYEEIFSTLRNEMCHCAEMNLIESRYKSQEQ